MMQGTVADFDDFCSKNYDDFFVLNINQWNMMLKISAFYLDKHGIILGQITNWI